LTRDPVAGILAPGNLLTLYFTFALAQETSAFWINLHHTRKNFLTFIAFALKMAQETTWFELICPKGEKKT